MAKDIIKVRGTLKRVYMKELTQEELDRIITPRTGPNAGNQVKIYDGKTHKLNIQMDDDKWYGGGAVKIRPGDPCILRKQVDDEWENIYEGAKVVFKAKLNGDYNPNIRWKTFDMEENGAPPENPFIYKQNEANSNADSNTQSANKPKFDPIGMMKGNAFNGAMEVLQHNVNVVTFDSVKGVAGEIFKANKTLQEKYPDENGATIGMVVKEACCMTSDSKEIIKIAEYLLTSVVSELNSYLDGDYNQNDYNQDYDRGDSENNPENVSGQDNQPIDDREIPF